MTRVLVVDDDAGLREMLEIMLTREGYSVVGEGDGLKALNRCRRERFDLVLTDLKMPKMDGLEFLKSVKEFSPGTQVILITAYATGETALRAMKEGAYDYVEKDFDVDDLKRLIREALEKKGEKDQQAPFERDADDAVHFGGMIAKNKDMLRIFTTVRKVADTAANVLLLGESGTGKELVAREVHRLSGRRGPFLAVNCGSLPANLVESELFGHARGAFTGAIAASPGLFRSATGGTLFLDEVGELPLSLQPRLLRVLEQGEVRPVGCPTTQRVDVRVVAATNADLDRACREERFRGDLLARLDQVRLSLPPLRRRRQDIPPLLAHFFQKHAPASPPHDYELDALERLLAYSWPYNVRELEKTVRLLLLEHPLLTRVTAALLPPCFAPAVSAPASAPARAASPQPSPATSCRVGPAGLPGREELVALLEQTHGRVSEVATALGKDRRQIYRWLRRHDLDPELFRG